MAEQKNVLLEHLYHKPQINPADIYKELKEYKEMIEPYVCDVSLYLYNAMKDGKNILLEGQLGSLKDPDHGIYPMVTSSSTLAAFGAIGAGIPPYEIKQIITAVSYTHLDVYKRQGHPERPDTKRGKASVHPFPEPLSGSKPEHGRTGIRTASLGRVCGIGTVPGLFCGAD